MKKGFALLCVLLAMLTATPALAQTTGVAIDGKVYTFTGGKGTYAADGMTFVIDDDEVTVIRADGAEVRMPLAHSAADCTVITSDVSAATVITSIQDEQITILHQVSDLAAIITDDAPVIVEKSGAAAYAHDEGIAVIAEDGDFTYILKARPGGENEFSQYAKFGLSYDGRHNVLYYLGKRVRVMEDEMHHGENVSSALQWFDDMGEVDVRAKRNDALELIDLETLSDAEFAARDLSMLTEPHVTRMEMTAASENELTPEERAAFFQPYEAVGIHYDAEYDLLFYQGRQVRTLVDIRKSNGEEPGSGSFSGELTQLVYDGGVVDVTTIRDYAHPDANGDGTLLGLIVKNAK